MVRSGYRIVIDTNVLLRGLVNSRSASGKILAAADRGEVVVVLSRAVVEEYRVVTASAEIVEKYPELEADRVELALRRVRYVGEYLRIVRHTFNYPRDPLDEKFIQLAVAGRATHLVTADRDLLSLRFGHGEPAKWLRRSAPGVRIVEPHVFVALIASSI